MKTASLNYILWFCGVLWFFVSFNACKSKTIIPSVPASLQSADSLSNALKNHNIDYDWFVAVGKGKYKNEEDGISTKTYLRLKKDSIIWMVAKKLAVEATRTLITPDSFFILYRLEQKYDKGSLQDLLDAQGIDYSFSEIQDFIVGNIPIPNSPSSGIEGNYNYLAGKYNELWMKIFFNPEDMRVDHGFVENPLKQTLRARFDDFRECNSGNKIPYFREYKINLSESSHLQATFEFSEISINVPKKTRFSIPDYYEAL